MSRPTSTIVPIMHVPSGAAIAELRIWEEEEFRRSEAQWQDLLRRSSADPLFMSWSWQWSWWSHHSALLNSELQLLAAYSASGELVGLAPLHLRRATHRKLLSAMRLDLIGSAWRHPCVAYSEYLDFVVDIRFEDAFIDALADAVLRDHRWSDLIVANSKVNGIAARFVRKYLSSACYIRQTDPLVAQLTALPAKFADYVKALHPSVRRKLWNHRSKLRDPQLTLVAAERIEHVFDQLNYFHRERWGAQLFLGAFRAFQLDFARLCAARGLLRMSTLEVAGKTISAMYNVRIGATEYNIQSGFEPAAVKGASPGYLHFGFCLEAACNDGLRGFDFMAGCGRTRDYKRDFITQETALATFQCIRMRPLAWLYKRYDRRFLATTTPHVALPVATFDCDTGYANIVSGIAGFLG